MQGWSGFLVAAGIGGLVGWVEIAQRYSDTPIGVLKWSPAWLYIGANVAASSAALGIIRALDWTFGQTNLNTRATVQALVAGFGAMALFRSRLLTAAKPSASGGEMKFVWSPATVLEGILRIADREARKVQGSERLQAARIVGKLTWVQAKELPPIVLYIMASDTDQEADEKRAAEFGRDVKLLEKNPDGYTDDQRKLLLGVLIVRYAGTRVLQDAISAYGKTD